MFYLCILVIVYRIYSNCESMWSQQGGGGINQSQLAVSELSGLSFHRFSRSTRLNYIVFVCTSDMSTVTKHTRKRQKRTDSYGIYIHKLLKAKVGSQTTDATISSKAMRVMDSLAIDVFECVAREASDLVHQNKKVTMTAADVTTAVKLVFGMGLAQRVALDIAKAVGRYEDSFA